MAYGLTPPLNVIGVNPYLTGEKKMPVVLSDEKKVKDILRNLIGDLKGVLSVDIHIAPDELVSVTVKRQVRVEKGQAVFDGVDVKNYLLMERESEEK